MQSLTQNEVKDLETQPHKQKRRTRNDPNNRNFTCGCGKAYLSYPALYTHLKQKHDGKAPEGTNLPQSNSKGIRGRPKKEDQGIVDKEEDEEEEEENTETSVEEENSLNELLYYLANLSKVLNKDIEKPISLVLEAENEDINALENFPQELFQNNQDYLSIMIFLKDLINNNGNIKEDFNDDSQLKKTLCDQVFAIFLYRIAKHITPECFKELCVFICIFRKTFNLKGWEVKKSQQVKNNETVISVFHENILPFCENNTAEFALEISNDFIIDYFPKYLKEIKCDQFKVIGEEEEKLKNVVYLTQHFCNWLFNNYYTNSRLSLNLN